MAHTPHTTPQATSHTCTVDVRLPPDTDGELVQALLQLLQDYGFSSRLQLLTVGQGQRLRLLGTPTPRPEDAP